MARKRKRKGGKCHIKGHACVFRGIKNKKGAKRPPLVLLEKRNKRLSAIITKRGGDVVEV